MRFIELTFFLPNHTHGWLVGWSLWHINHMGYPMPNPDKYIRYAGFLNLYFVKNIPLKKSYLISSCTSKWFHVFLSNEVVYLILFVCTAK